MSVAFDFTQKNVQLATSGPPEIWQDHQISRTGGPMVQSLETSISRPEIRLCHIWIKAILLYPPT